MKKCPGCKEFLPLASFHPCPSAKSGIRSRCKKCNSAAANEWNKKNRDKTKAWRASNRDKCSGYSKKWKTANPGYHRNRKLVVKYGITEEVFQSILDAQGGVCACCGTEKPNGRHSYWHTDHDHESGDVRGILCSACNMGIGLLGDSLDGVMSAANYLRGSVAVTERN